MTAVNRFAIAGGVFVAGVLFASVVVTGVAQDRRQRPERVARERGEPTGEFVQVTIRGTLESGVVAIGGETTGTTITANSMRFELDLGDDAELRRKAERLSGQQALVRGRLTRREGVEIPVRWIVKVRRISAPDAEDPEVRPREAPEKREADAEPVEPRNRLEGVTDPVPGRGL